MSDTGTIQSGETNMTFFYSFMLGQGASWLLALLILYLIDPSLF